MAFDMTGNWQLGGSSGLLDWGSDIARSWGLGIQNGLQYAHAFRDMQARSLLEPSQIAAQYTGNVLQQQQLQNRYTPEFYQGAAEAAAGRNVVDYYQQSPNYNYGVQQTPTPVYNAQQQHAPQSTTNSAVANSLNAAGNQNVATTNPTAKQPLTPQQQQALSMWRGNTYDSGGS